MIVVTVPHATCPPKEDTEAWAVTGDHACDFVGPRSGRELAKRLKWEGLSVMVIEAHAPRTDLDMNRRASRNSDWRRKIASIPGVSCLIDSHSYPVDMPEFFGSDLVLYTEAAGAVQWENDIAKAITGKDEKFACGMVDNPVTTDIVQAAHERMIPAILIEFSEGLDGFALRIACERIARFVRDRVYSFPPPRVFCRACHALDAPRYYMCTGGCVPPAVYCSRDCQERDAKPHMEYDACPGVKKKEKPPTGMTKLTLTYDGVSPREFSHPRVYTVTHSDETGAVAVIIGRSAAAAASDSRDEVVGEWLPDRSALRVTVTETLGNDPAVDRKRVEAYRLMLPKVIEWLVNVERPLFRRHPELLESGVVVAFKGAKETTREENWKRLKDYVRAGDPDLGTEK